MAMAVMVVMRISGPLVSGNCRGRARRTARMRKSCLCGFLVVVVVLAVANEHAKPLENSLRPLNRPDRSLSDPTDVSISLFLLYW